MAAEEKNIKPTPASLTIVIPAHNEAGRIGPMLTSYIEHFQKRANILLILNGCRDNTLEVINSIIERIGDLGDISYRDIKEPIGKAAAVYEGFRLAATAYVGFVDADGSTPAFEYDRLFQSIDNADGVIASRFMPMSHVVNRTLIRRLISLPFHRLVRHYVKLPYRDTQCGAKIFKTAIVKKILDDLTVRDNAFDVELLMVLKERGYVIKEEPTLWIEESSSTMFSSPLKLFTAAWRMYRTLVSLAKRYT
ncbi:MAG: glycosyltransferase [Patescibacteria group bacterium]